MAKKQLSLDNMKIKKDANEKARLIDLTLYTQKELKDYQINYLDPTKTLAGNQYTFDGYHPREIREIEQQQLEQLHERLVKEKLIQKNIRKEVRYQKNCVIEKLNQNHYHRF